MAGAPTAQQADGADRPTFANHAEEIAWHLAERAKRVGTTETCWDCGSEYVVKDARQRECVRCYVARKL